MVTMHISLSYQGDYECAEKESFPNAFKAQQRQGWEQTDLPRMQVKLR